MLASLIRFDVKSAALLMEVEERVAWTAPISRSPQGPTSSSGTTEIRGKSA
jgi:hypothetical protein